MDAATATSPAMTHIAERIRAYIRESFQDDEPSFDFGNDEDLLMILDSLQILRMLMDLETEYSVKVENGELAPENLGTVDRLAAFIEKKQREAMC